MLKLRRKAKGSWRLGHALNGNLCYEVYTLASIPPSLTPFLGIIPKHTDKRFTTQEP